MLRANLKNNDQSEKLINKDEVSTIEVSYSYGKSIIFKMKNGETFSVYYSDEIMTEMRNSLNG